MARDQPRTMWCVVTDAHRERANVRLQITPVTVAYPAPRLQEKLQLSARSRGVKDNG
ncbi:MAG: hypothetical protein ACIWVG_02165 [Gloeotrichia echinulata HAB0833]